MAGCPRRWALKKWRQGRGMETQVKGCVGMELPRQMGLRPITHNKTNTSRQPVKHKPNQQVNLFFSFPLRLQLVFAVEEKIIRYFNSTENEVNKKIKGL